MTVLTTEVWERAVTVLRDGDDIALACHLGPDGDALGSLLALALALRKLGKRTVASWGSEPFRVPPQYAFLPGLDLLSPPGEFPVAPDVLVTFDTGSVDRLGSLAPVAEKAAHVLVVDHHVSNTGYGDVNLVEPDAAASAVLVEELIRRLGVPLDAEIAACLYTGLTTDTGSFKFQATTADVHALAGRLLATGIDHAAIAREIWDTNRFSYVKLLGVLLDRARLDRDRSWVWTYSTRDDFTAFGIELDEIEGVIDVLRTVHEAEVATVFKETPEGAIAVSMRSKGAVDVGAICVALGGGGHRYAAGFTSLDSRDATVDVVAAALTET